MESGLSLEWIRKIYEVRYTRFEVRNPDWGRFLIHHKPVCRPAEITKKAQRAQRIIEILQHPTPNIKKNTPTDLRPIEV